MILRNVEFNGLPGPDGEVEVRIQTNPVFILKPSDRNFVISYIDLLKYRRPLAYERLYNRFKSSKENRMFHEFLICRRHIKCNYAGLDSLMDIDENGNFGHEYVYCPHANECPDYGIVCNSSETILLKSEVNVLRLIKDGHTNKEISELLFLSEHTVHNHRNNMLKRTGCKNTAELVRYWYENNLR